MQLIITRPHTITLDPVRTLFFGMHLTRGKFRYYADCGWDSNISLSPMLQQVSHIWHAHAYEVDTMATVVFELRQCLSLSDVAFDDCDTVDQVFVECFESAYQNVSGAASRWRTFGPPSHERPVDQLANWDTRYDTFTNVPGSPQGANRFHWIGSDGEESEPPVYN